MLSTSGIAMRANNVIEPDSIVMVTPESVIPPLGHIPAKPRTYIGPAVDVFTEIWGQDRAGKPKYLNTAIKVPLGTVYRGYRIEQVPKIPEVLTESVAPNALILVAIPVGEGIPLIGIASHICIALWGTTKSGSPCNISVVINRARSNAEYKGYTWRVLSEMPTILGDG